MRPDDLVRIRHMMDAAREAKEFVRGRTRKDLDDDRMLSLALVKCIEIVGEAASRVSEETRVTHSAIPWAAAAAMRNRLVHAYFDVDLDRVWDTVADDLPGLVSVLREVVAARD
jgi:uncharacterized protein with HEPN domain